jgi:hypothetical protein
MRLKTKARTAFFGAEPKQCQPQNRAIAGRIQFEAAEVLPQRQAISKPIEVEKWNRRILQRS